MVRKVSHVRQWQSDIFSMISTVILSSRLGTCYTVEFRAADLYNNWYGQVQRSFTIALNAFGLIVLSNALAWTLAAIFAHRQDDMVPYYVDLMRYATFLEITLGLRFKRKRVTSLLCSVQQILSLFPDALIKQSNYKKACWFIWFYVILQGFSASRAVTDHHKYIHDRYLGILDSIFTPDRPKLTKLFAVFDICTKSSVYRATGLFEIVLFVTLCNEITKRYQIFNNQLSEYFSLLKEQRAKPNCSAIDWFQETHEKLRCVILELDSIYGPAQATWFSLYVALFISEVNSVVLGGFRGGGATTALAFFVRLMIICLAFNFIVSYSASIDNESKLTRPLLERISTMATTEDIEFINELEVLKSRIQTTDTTLTVWGFFRLQRRIITKGYSVLIGYLFLTLQITIISRNN